MLHRMRRLGITPSRMSDLSTVDTTIRNACEAAWPAAQQRLQRPSRDGAVHGNGWRINLTTIGSYGTDFVRRAAVSHFGLRDARQRRALPDAFHKGRACLATEHGAIILMPSLGWASSGKLRLPEIFRLPAV
jgi:hypothetical protein